MKSFAIIMVAVASLMSTAVKAVDVGTPCDELATTTPIDVGDIITCSIEVVADLDIYTFSGTSGDTLRLSSSCDTCHALDDPHRGGFGSRCDSCHSERSWKDVRVPR